MSLLAASAVSLIAYRGRLLTWSGALAAAVIGAVALHAGRDWVVLLLTFFVSSNLLSRWRAAERESRAGGIAEKGDRRDTAQVLANGGVFAVAAVASTFSESFAWHAVGAGAIAAAMADTWSTEVGTLLGDAPRDIVSGELTPPGTSGAISVAGSTAGLCGALLAALLVSGMDWRVPVVAVVTAGLAGSVVDSVLGATVQERRWCDQCSKATERRTHVCGSPTRWTGGVREMNNDLVNLACTVAGAATAWWYA